VFLIARARLAAHNATPLCLYGPSAKRSHLFERRARKNDPIDNALASIGVPEAVVFCDSLRNQATSDSSAYSWKLSGETLSFLTFSPQCDPRLCASLAPRARGQPFLSAKLSSPCLRTQSKSTDLESSVIVAKGKSNRLVRPSSADILLTYPCSFQSTYHYSMKNMFGDERAAPAFV
jgi:hypothetical protein